MSLKEAVFPSELKLAKVVPIFKSGESDKVTNYRPISVLSFFFPKIFGNKFIIMLLILWINMIQCINFSLGSENNTPLAIITLVDKITSSLDSSDIIIGVFLDLKKAFDTVTTTHRISACVIHTFPPTDLSCKMGLRII